MFDSLKVTVISRGNKREGFYQSDIHTYSQKEYGELQNRILRYTGHRSFSRLRLYWEDSERDRISITTYQDLKSYIEGCIRVGRRCEIFVRREKKEVKFFRDMRRLFRQCFPKM